MPTGRAGESGFPGSTGQTRTFRGRNPRAVEIRADTNTGWESGVGVTSVERQASYRGDVPGGSTRNPRATSTVRTPRGAIVEFLQDNDSSEFFGGPALHTRAGNDNAGGNPGSKAYCGVRDTETPPTQREPVIGAGTPGSANVRNEIAQRYKNTPGQVHTYHSASRPDQADPARNGQAADGSVKPDQVSSPVSVPNRFVFPGGGNITYAMLREMPYGGRGNGARGAALSGERYYGTGQADQFWNGGQGDYGVSRLRGARHKRPVAFTQPAPWSANYYDTTADVGTPDAPGPGAQSPNMIYVSPAGGRASNSTGRTG